MANDLAEVENELRSVLQEKRRVEEQIREIQQHMGHDETWIEMNAPATVGYQETLEELLALQAYVGELYAQVASLDDVILELKLEQAYWQHPEQQLASSADAIVSLIESAESFHSDEARTPSLQALS